ncbi:MAG: hypothetical protein LBQ52_05415 [Helicobacteraceae bacterium]|jgi:hypothetical protein|nr:hypothetical protein [Helicobacteraceae bacterium]
MQEPKDKKWWDERQEELLSVRPRVFAKKYGIPIGTVSHQIFIRRHPKIRPVTSLVCPACKKNFEIVGCVRSRFCSQKCYQAYYYENKTVKKRKRINKRPERNAEWYKRRDDDALSLSVSEFIEKYKCSRTMYYKRRVKCGASKPRKQSSWWEERKEELLALMPVEFAKKYDVMPAATYYWRIKFGGKKPSNARGYQ